MVEDADIRGHDYDYAHRARARRHNRRVRLAAHRDWKIQGTINPGELFLNWQNVDGFDNEIYFVVRLEFK